GEDELGQTRAAALDVARACDAAELDELRVRVGQARMRRDLSVSEARRLFVEGAIGGEEPLPREPPRRSEKEREGLAVVPFEARQGGEGRRVVDLVQQEVDQTVIEEGIRHRQKGRRIEPHRPAKNRRSIPVQGSRLYTLRGLVRSPEGGSDAMA